MWGIDLRRAHKEQSTERCRGVCAEQRAQMEGQEVRKLQNLRKLLLPKAEKWWWLQKIHGVGTDSQHALCLRRLQGFCLITSFPPRPPFPSNELTTGPIAGQSFQITLTPGLG